MPKPELIIVSGANGAGKTTFAIEYATHRNFLYLGADHIAMELSPEAPHKIPVTAGKELRKRLAAALEAKETVVLESTLSGRTFRHTIQIAQDAGYKITIIYLFLYSADTCVDRVYERVKKGGHAVPEPDIRRRFTRSISNFWHLYRQLADRWLLVYNSGNQPVDVAIGTTEGISIRDAEMFEVFNRLIGVKHDERNF